MERCERVVAAKNLLWALEGSKYRNRLCGVCEWVDAGMAELIERGKATYSERRQSHALLRDIFKEWPEYSGSLSFPVPSPSGRDPWDAFNKCKNKFCLFTRYGRARRRLLKFIKNRCREIIQEG